MSKLLLFLFSAAAFFTLAAAPKNFQESPRKSDEWGFRPAEGESSAVTPTPFVWQPQQNAQFYELEYARNAKFSRDKVRVSKLPWNAYCPSQAMKPGVWFWRVRFVDNAGVPSTWSGVRRFTIAEDAVEFPMPTRQEFEARIPKTHPRLMVRPEELPELRKKADSDLKEEFNALIAAADKLVAAPPDASEPQKYPEGMKFGSPEWQKIWWGNRMRTLKVLDGAATLGFAYQLTGNRTYGDLAKKLLLACAAWDPKGSSSRAYNDEVAIPFLSRFSRTYSYVNELLTEAERQQCRDSIRVRGNDFYRALCPNHFYKPFNSHNNRAWHFLGEAAVAFYGEIPEASDWLAFALNVYYCVYPVWGDDDGGWHEGLWYWGEYMERFFYWGDVMRSAFNINVCTKPFFARTGYYAMYCQPPGTQNGGFGDLAELHRDKRSALVMRFLAAQSGNPYWQWYADQLTPAWQESTYITYLRGAMPRVKPKKPVDLPTSRCFRGTGLAFLNTDLTDGRNNVQLLFKSSPRGTISHGYDSNNSFILNVFSEPMLIHSGIRDNYASNFHKYWMWDTKSVNSITVNNVSQKRGVFDAPGEITGFSTGKRFDYVGGEAAESYPAGTLKGFRRQILFCKPSAILIVDTLEAPAPAEFAFRLHAVNEMQLGEARADVVNGEAACRVDFLHPAGLRLEQTDKFDPPPEFRKQPNQYHLTAIPAEKSERAIFITLLRPHRVGDALKGEPAFRKSNSGFTLSVPLPEGTLEAKIGNDASISAKLGTETFQTP